MATKHTKKRARAVTSKKPTQYINKRHKQLYSEIKRYPTGERLPGKIVGQHIYIHKSAISHLVPDDLSTVLDRLRMIKNIEWDYDIIKLDRINRNVSFIQAYGWNELDEPITGDSLIVYRDGTIKIHKMSKNDPLIYHHKWAFVGDDYTGFDPQQSFERSERWITNPSIQHLLHDPEERFSCKIGRLSYWTQNVTPRLRKTKKKTKGRKSS